MAVQTPAHAQRLRLTNFFHLVDAAMAGNASNALSYVNGVIEVGMLRKHVHLHPLNWLSRFVGVTHELKPRAFCLNHAVATHAGFCRRNGSKGSTFNRAVAIPTIHAHLACVQLVAERHRLLRRVADISPLWRKKVPNEKNHTNESNGGTNRNQSWNSIGPLRKNGCHSITFMHEGSTREIRMMWVSKAPHTDRISSSSRLTEQVSHQKIELRNFRR